MIIDKLKTLKLTQRELDFMKAMTSGPMHMKFAKDEAAEMARDLEGRGLLDQYAPDSVRINDIGTSLVHAYMLTPEKVKDIFEQIECSDDNEAAAGIERDLHFLALLATAVRSDDSTVASIAFIAWRTKQIDFRRGY